MNKITEREIITLGEAIEHDKYADKWFIFLYTGEKLMNAEDRKGYVAYTFESREEMSQAMPILNKEVGEVSCAVYFGNRVKTRIEL